jgi:hypothetical protein
MSDRSDHVELQAGSVHMPAAFREVARLANQAGLEGYRLVDADVGIDTEKWDCMEAASIQSRVLITYEKVTPAGTVTIILSPIVSGLLEVLTRGDTPMVNSVDGVVAELVDHAQQGVYRPGSWEREWLRQAFGSDFEKYLEPGDPYGNRDRVDRGRSQRPVKA